MDNPAKEKSFSFLIIIFLVFFPFGKSMSQDISTIGEIYDFEVGDIFHHYEHFTAPDYVRNKTWNIVIMDKYYSEASYLTYIRHVSVMKSENGGPFVYEFVTDTVTYGPLDFLINQGEINNVYSLPDMYNGRKINERAYHSGSYDWMELHWVDGCGFCYWHYEDNNNFVYFDQELVYFKKGEEEWGTPHPVGIAEGDANTWNLKCYPNPFTTSTTIEYELYTISSIQYTVYNMTGEAVFGTEEKHLFPGRHSITWSPGHLPAGMYYAVLRSKEGVKVLKLIKQ